MVRNYKRKTERGRWSEEAMKRAISAVLENKMGYYLAAKSFSVPQTTLERKVKMARENSNSVQNIKVPLGPKLPIFSVEEEAELVEYLLDMESRLFGLTTNDLVSLVYQLATKNNKSHPFNDERAKAGKDWLYGFLNRHPDLTIRKPENTSAARAGGFNRVSVGRFFELLGKVYDEFHLTVDRVYNCDETGISVVPKARCNIIAKTGRKQVGALVSAERGTTITVEVCFSATGHYMPPMMVFPRKRMKPELMANAAPGAWGVCSDSGWMTSEIFLQWFKKFVIFSGASKDRPVLLLLDGHSTHTKNIFLIDEARANGVVILCFPPHTTHRIQPLDVAFMKPVSSYYDQAISAWLRSNPGLVVTSRQVAELFGKAFVKAATMSTAVNGFKKCGIWPFDTTVFTDSDFVASTTTEIPLNESEEPISNRENPDIDIQPSAENTGVSSSSPQPGCSFWPDNQLTSQPGKEVTSFAQLSPKHLMPIPATKQKIRVSRRRGKTAIITSDPYKNELIELIKRKKESNEIKENKKKEKLQKKIKGKGKKPVKCARKDTTSSKESEKENDTPCLYCNGRYLQSNEGWISCQICGKWAHCSCAGVEDEDDEATHVCPLCKPGV